jgi:hypothetical protein
MAAKIQKCSDLDEIWIPSRLWCCELISIVGLLWRPFWIQNNQSPKLCLGDLIRNGAKTISLPSFVWET